MQLQQVYNLVCLLRETALSAMMLPATLHDGTKSYYNMNKSCQPGLITQGDLRPIALSQSRQLSDPFNFPVNAREDCMSR